jgi:tRNA nucleotidyltransferase (CCA-adding enzyme)
MKLPAYVLECIDALEAAGFSAYAVGGCVRDWLLGLAPHDFDLCTSALPEQMQRVFANRDLVLAGLKHGTVGVIFPEGVVEITTYRTEGGYTDSRHPDWVRFVDRVEEDLARRDFTVNAMAWSPSRGLQDPFGGAEDLKQGILRAVGNPQERFREDALRILRGARFAARFALKPDEQTYEAMLQMAPLMENLARERVYSELCKLLMTAEAEDLLRYAPVITQVIPELAPAVGFDQRSVYHAYDLYTHIAHVTAAVPRELPLRWAALLHDVGKPETFTLDEQGRGHFYGHGQLSAKLADQILHRLKAPTALREQVVQLVEQHMTPLLPDRKLLRRRLNRMGTEQVQRLLELQEADMCSKGTGICDGEKINHFSQLRSMITQLLEEDTCLTIRDLAVNGRDLMRLGIPAGKKLGEVLQSLLEAVLDETLPNEKNALLEAAEALRIDSGSQM